MAQNVLIRALDAEFKVTAQLLPARPKRVTYPKLYNLLGHLPAWDRVSVDTDDSASDNANDGFIADAEYNRPLPARVQDDPGMTKLVLLCLFFGSAPFISGAVLDSLLDLAGMIRGDDEGEVGYKDKDDTGSTPTFPDFEAFYNRVLQCTIDAQDRVSVTRSHTRKCPDDFVCALSPKRRVLASQRLELKAGALTRLCTRCKL